MKVLLVGSGGREHALAWSLSRSPLVDRLLCAPGNPGMASVGECHSVDTADLEGIADIAEDEGVDLVVVGPEAPLVAGGADLLRERGIRVFGPSSACARLEGSKSYAKRLMNTKGIPTAAAAEFERSDEAIAYVRKVGPPPAGVVVKADGLAAGKGVTVCDDLEQAEAAITAALEDGRFGAAGRRILIEERLEGEELSVLAFCDGKTVLPMEPAQDFKRAFDGDRGPNTGGMGSYSPVASCTSEVLGRVTDEILEPIAGALAEDAGPYVGVIYAGLMLTTDGPKVLEFNCRFGDPETQALLPRLTSDLAELAAACSEESLAGMKLRWRDEACVSVVVASEGYPGAHRTGFPIEGLEEAEALSGLPVFHAGTKATPDGRIVTGGGRVLAVGALGRDFAEARARVYAGVGAISFPGMMFRRDIAARAAQEGVG